MKVNLKTFPEYDEVFLAGYLADIKRWHRDFEAELREIIEGEAWKVLGTTDKYIQEGAIFLAKEILKE